ncbi:MAG: LysM peptidoglycan-binding domain-containing protein [Desulfobacterium sp.]|nr:LysM peptidoglycan-binding domain-containing protein [Desulfobacterium sp.]
MGYTGISYKIKQGDTLWNLAATHLGSPTEWPRLYEFNNRNEVVRAGARRIIDPDLIYAGSTLRLPILQSPGTPVASMPLPPAGHSQNLPSANVPHPGRLRDKLPSISMPYASAYELKNNLMLFDFGTYIARVKMVGRVVVTLGNALPLTLVANGNFEATAKSRSDNTFTSLMSETQVGYDPATGHIKFSNKMITCASNIPGPSYAVGIETSTASGMPVLKTEILYPELKGRIGQDSYTVMALKIEIEIEPRQPIPPRPVPVKVYEQTPSARQMPKPGTDWWEAIKDASVGVLVVATVVTVAYGASVVFTGGGTSLAAPGYASAMGILLVGGTAVTISVRTAHDQKRY